MKVKFNREDLLEILDGNSYVVSDEITGKSRWSVIHTLIFKWDDKLYRTTYSRGATECQEEYPWEYEETVDCTEVEAYEKTVTAYREVK